MRIKYTPKNVFEWHRWFAWYPVFITAHNNQEYFVWLEYVNQRGWQCNEYVFYEVKFLNECAN